MRALTLGDDRHRGSAMVTLVVSLITRRHDAVGMGLCLPVKKMAGLNA